MTDEQNIPSDGADIAPDACPDDAKTVDEDVLSPPKFVAKYLKGMVSERQIRRLCEDGMDGAFRCGRAWKVKPSIALKWLANPANAPKIANRLPMELPGAGAIKAEPATTAPSNGVSSVLETKVDDLSTIANALLSIIKGGTINPTGAKMLKDTLVELRQAGAHVLDMQKADRRLMDRDRHRFLMANLASMFRMELEGMESTVPDVMMSALTDAGLEVGRIDKDGVFEADAGAAIRIFAVAVELESRRQLERLADQVEASKLDELNAAQRRDG